MRKRLHWLAIIGTPLAFALPLGVKWTALGLSDGSGSVRLWLGLLLLTVGIFGVECLRRCVGLASAEPGRPGIGAGDPRKLLEAARVLEAVALVLLPVATALQFALLLDGHVHLRACGWLLLAYSAGAVLVLVMRSGATAPGSCYLRWGWAPLVAFGVPLGLPVLLAAGLVAPVIPPR
jgi:hypothetical protein